MFQKLFGRKQKAPAVTRADLHTDSGMLCAWDAKTFSGITDYDSWEKDLCEDADLLRHITAGHLVPLNLGDGAFAVEVRHGSAEEMQTLSEREQKFLVVSSQPYRIKTTGRVLVTGLEQVGRNPQRFIEVGLSAGDYEVRAHLIDWTEEPGSKDGAGQSTPNALPDFILCFSPAGSNGGPYRTELKTFRKEDSLR